MTEAATAERRAYDLRKRTENMDHTRRTVLAAARRQLEAEGYRQMTMAALAVESGVTRQTIHNLFGSKRAVLETLFDTLALEGGMERMREVMQQPDPEEKLKAFIEIFCLFWEKHRMLFRRIHGLGAVDPDFGELVHARNQRRHDSASRLAAKWTTGKAAHTAAATLTALTSFEFYDAALESGATSEQAQTIILRLALAALREERDYER